MKKPHESAFTLIELLIILAALSLIAVFSIPALNNHITRSRVPSMARQTATLIQVARSEAVKRGVPSVVEVTNEGGVQVVRAFVDVDDDQVLEPSAGDQVLGTLHFPRWVVPSNSHFSRGVDGFFGTNHKAVFLANGSIRDTGAFRFRGQPGTGIEDQLLEVRISPQATAKVQIRAWSVVDQDGIGPQAVGE